MNNLQFSANRRKQVSTRGTSLHLEEIRDYTMYLQGYSVVNIAEMRGLTRDAIHRRIRKVKKHIGELPGVEKAKDAISDMVREALAVYQQRLGALDAKVATNVLVSTGVLNLKPTPPADDMIHKSTEQLWIELIQMIKSVEDPNIIEALRNALEDDD